MFLTSIITKVSHRKLIFITIFAAFLHTSGIYSQSDTSKSLKVHKKALTLSLGMGVSYGNMSSFNNYLKELIGVADSVKSFNIGVEFFGGIEKELSKTFSLRLEYAYFLRSRSYSSGIYSYDFFIHIHQPYLMANYLLKYRKFQIELGAGAGYHLAYLQSTQGQNNVVNYSSTGPAFKGEGIFSAYFSKSLRTYISGFVYGSTQSSLKDGSGNVLKSPQTNSEVNLGGFGVGVRLGISILLY